MINECTFPLIICILETHKNYLGNSEDSDEMLHDFVRVYTVCLDKKKLGSKIHDNLENQTCDTLKNPRYNMYETILIGKCPSWMLT